MLQFDKLRLGYTLVDEALSPLRSRIAGIAKFERGTTDGQPEFFPYLFGDSRSLFGTDVNRLARPP